MTIVLDGTNGINTPDLESAGPVVGTTGTFSGNVTLGTSVLATPTGSAPSYTCRAWVNFNGTGTVAIRASGNVTSITDNGVGDYTVNFTTAMPDANYSAVVTGYTDSINFSNSRLLVGGYLSGSCRTQIILGTGGTVDVNVINVNIFR